MKVRSSNWALNILRVVKRGKEGSIRNGTGWGEGSEEGFDIKGGVYSSKSEKQSLT